MINYDILKISIISGIYNFVIKYIINTVLLFLTYLMFHLYQYK